MKWRKIIIVLLVLMMIAAGTFAYLYNKKPANIRKAAADYETTAAALMAAYNTDEAGANARYLDKVIAVDGKISQIDLDANNPTVFLETGDPAASVTCSFYSTEIPMLKPLTTGANIKIKGVCTGMLMDVVLNKCSIVE